MVSSNRSTADSPEQRQVRSDALDRVSDGVVALDSELRYTYVNRRAADLLDTDSESLLGEYIWDAFPDPQETTAQDAIERAIETGQRTSFERYNQELKKWWKVRVHPDDTGITIFFSDITEQKDRQYELERADTLFQNTQDGLFVIDVEDDGETFRVNRVNQAYEAVSGVPAGELQGKTIRDIADERESTSIREKYRECVRGRKPLQYEEFLSAFNGGSWWETRIAPVIGDGEVTQIVGSTRNISDRKEREQRLQKFERMVEYTGHAVFFTGVDGQIEYVNPEFERLTGYTAADALGETPDLLSSGEHDDPFFADLWETVLSGDVWSGEIVNTRKDGTRFVANHTIAPVMDDSGDVTHFVAIYDDITDQKEREKELRRKTRALDNAPVGISIADPSRADNPITYANDAFTETTGYDEDEVVGENCRFLQGQRTDPEKVAKIRDAIDEARQIDLVLRNYRKDDTPFWNQLSIAPVRDEDGTLERFVGFQKDITEQKEREQRLQTHELVVQTMNEVAFLVDDEKRIQFANDAALDLADVPLAAIKGRSIGSVTEEMAAPDEDPQRFLDAVDALLRDGDPDAGEWVQEPDGTETLSLEFDFYLESVGELCAEQRFVPVELYDGGRGVAVVSRDVTKRRQQEQKIQAHLEQAQEIGHVGSWYLNLETDDLQWSDECYRLFGLEPGTPMTYGRFLEMVHPEDREKVDRAWNEALEDGGYDIEHRIVVDGETRWVQETAEVTFGEDGDPTNGIGVVRDITEEKRRKKRISVAKKRYQTLLHGGPDPVFVVDSATGEVIETNSAAASLRGQHNEAMEGLHQSELHPPDEREKAQQLFSRAVAQEGEYREYSDGSQIHAVTSTGEKVPIEITVSTFDLPERSVTYGIFRDITERVEREREIRTQKRRYESLFNSVSGAIVVTDLDGRIIASNPGFTDLFGYDSDDIEGDQINKITSDGANVEPLLEKEKGSRESLIINYRKSSGQVFAGESRSLPLRTHDGGIRGHVVHVVDVSEAQENREQLQVLGRILRHNVRNYMNVVMAQAQLIREHGSNTVTSRAEKIIEKSRKFVELAENQQRITKLLTEKAGTDDVDLVPLTKQAVSDVQKQYPEATLKMDLATEGRARTSHLIDEAVRELLQNAVIHSDQEHPNVDVQLRCTDTITELKIRDDGPGIPEQEWKVLTQDGEITPLSHGTGLGLWFVNQVVRHSNGTLSIDTDDSKGTTVVVRLPAG